MYFEIQVIDIERAKLFYGNIFNWQFFKNPNAPIEYYHIEGAPQKGGLLKAPIAKADGPCGTNAFCCSFMVENFDETAAKIVANGGIAVMPKMAIAGTCWQGYFIDTEKNVFGIFEVDENAK